MGLSLVYTRAYTKTFRRKFSAPIFSKFRSCIIHIVFSVIVCSIKHCQLYTIIWFRKKKIRIQHALIFICTSNLRISFTLRRLFYSLFILSLSIVKCLISINSNSATICKNFIKHSKKSNWHTILLLGASHCQFISYLSRFLLILVKHTVFHGAKNCRHSYKMFRTYAKYYAHCAIIWIFNTQSEMWGRTIFFPCTDN